MELIARVGERVERVSIERQEARYRIRVGEREHVVEPRSLGHFVRSLLVDGESHEAAVFRGGPGAWRVGWLGTVLLGVGLLYFALLALLGLRPAQFMRRG